MKYFYDRITESQGLEGRIFSPTLPLKHVPYVLYVKKGRNNKNVVCQLIYENTGGWIHVLSTSVGMKSSSCYAGLCTALKFYKALY